MMEKAGQLFAANIRTNDLAFRYDTTTIAILLGETAEKEAMFAVEAGGQPRQRVLVLRAGRPGDPGPDDLPTVPNPSRRPSIAAEAS